MTRRQQLVPLRPRWDLSETSGDSEGQTPEVRFHSNPALFPLQQRSKAVTTQPRAHLRYTVMGLVIIKKASPFTIVTACFSRGLSPCPKTYQVPISTIWECDVCWRRSLCRAQPCLKIPSYSRCEFYLLLFWGAFMYLRFNFY